MCFLADTFIVVNQLMFMWPILIPGSYLWWHASQSACSPVPFVVGLTDKPHQVMSAVSRAARRSIDFASILARWQDGSNRMARHLVLTTAW